jgi:aminoglycoside 3-N-acetyltransferase
MDKKIAHEKALIGLTTSPMTLPRLQADFETLGLKRGMCLMVHCSMSKIGWIPGGAQLLVEAMIDFLGPEGTLMVPTHSTHLTDPATWQAPPIPNEWHDETRNSFPAFDPDKTATRGMGQFAEAVRTWPGAIRSNHPHTSFCAIGRLASDITAGHQLSSPMGPGSPLQKLCDNEGTTLLLGVGFGNNTCFHLAEESLDNPPRLIDGAPILVDGKSVWTIFDAVDYNEDDFAACGTAFEQTGETTIGTIGAAPSTLFSTRSAVEFARVWLRQNR